MHVLTLSTLFPDVSRPNFGVFVERQTIELAAREGIRVTVIAPIGVPPWPLRRIGRYAGVGAVPERENWKGLTVYRPRFPIIPKIGGCANVVTMASAILPLARELHREHPIDVIDASFFFPDGPVARRLSKKLGIPYSIKARGADIDVWGRRFDTRGEVGRAGRDAGGLLAVSEAMRQSMIAIGMNGDKIAVHYTGVDQDRFDIADRDAAKQALGLAGRPVILSVGALIPRKAQELIVRALPAIPEAVLLLAGDGPTREALERLADKLGVAGRVRLAGAIAHDELPRLYAAADVMALVSRSEGLANAWVEALACGTPIVISEAGGACELIDRPAAGRIVDPRPETIAEAVRAILDDPPDRGAVREAARRFSWKTNGDMLVDHLLRVAKR